jgi:phospholipid/cholesterol/gamma-HCH transport system substrate-binding protein
MGRTFVESIMGAVVLAVAGIFLVFALSQSDLGMVKGYALTAKFASVGGLTNGADVRINGIKVGSVLGQKIAPDTFEAIVHFSIRPDIHLPDDTVASVDSEGMLGSKFLKLDPGRSTKLIAEGGTIANTKTPQALEDQVSRVIFLATEADKAKPGDKK